MFACGFIYVTRRGDRKGNIHRHFEVKVYMSDGGTHELSHDPLKSFRFCLHFISHAFLL